MSWRPITELVNPMTITWRISCPWGISRIRLAVDWAGAAGEINIAKDMAYMYWFLLWAPALGNDTSCELIEGAHATDLNFSFIQAGPASGGKGGPGCAPRSETPVWLCDTGDTDPWGTRRLYLPGAPAGWVANGRLTEAGRAGSQTWARAFYLTGNQSQKEQWIRHALFRVIRPWGAPFGVGQLMYRTIRQVRVCEHTAKAVAGL